MKIGFICDIHMPDDKQSPQYAFLMRALEELKKDGISTVINLGDITFNGEEGALELYRDALKDFESYILLGNWDASNPETFGRISEFSDDINISVGKRRITGVNTPFGDIEEKDRKRLLQMRDGDIALMHHGPHRINEESRTFIRKLASEKNITLIHAHSHRSFDYMIGDSHIIGLRALDPDKSIGNFPCVTCFDITDDEISFEEKLITTEREVLLDLKAHFGLSCVDNHRDVTYATEKKVPYIELRCNGGDWFPDMTLLPKLDEWRKETNGYLSIHMPNLKWDGENISGEDKWLQAVDYAIKTGADSLTMHPPRVVKKDMPENGAVWQKFVSLYAYAVEKVGGKVKAGIENLHMTDSEQSHSVEKDNLRFGYTPEEVTKWIDAVNLALGQENRVGHILDVGHARNNGNYASLYPSSRWYGIMGKKTVAYHIHQVTPTENGAINHNAIEEWFGPLINYSSFFYAWGENMLNHVPVFLEVKGAENYQKSIDAFERILSRGVL